MELRSIVKLFERVGAKCRKLRRKNIYECWRGDVTARITEEGITIVSPGEFRIWYSEFATEEGVSERDFLRDLKEVTDADSTDIEIPCGELSLKLGFSLDKAEKAALVFKKISDNDMWVAITNMRGELRLIKKGKSVSVDEWLRTFKE